jgi:DHA2 family multidrug resistance protein
MFFFGFVLYGSIMLLPLYLQTLMGYNATLAGWALAFGGIGSILIMPVVGRLTMVVDSRKIVFVGLVINAYAVYLMSQYNTDINFFHAWFPRFIQGFGLGATFVSLTTLTMSRISQEKMGNATGIFNLMRNLGGSFGIATATTLLARRSQFHQNRLVEHLTPLSQPFNDWQQRLSQALTGFGNRLAVVECPRGHGRALSGSAAPGQNAGLLRRLLVLHHRLSLPAAPGLSHAPHPQACYCPGSRGAPLSPSLIRRTLVL